MKKVLANACLALALFSTVAISGCKKEKEEEPKPKACIQTSATTFEAGEAVAFTSCSDNATEYLWNFDDGTTSTSKNPTHTFTLPGTYTVSLKATGAGGSATKNLTITITGATAADYVGDFLINDACQSGTYQYTISITATSANTISIYNIGGYGSPVTVAATVNGTSFTITGTTSSTGVTVTGSGSISTDFQQITTSTVDNSNDACGGSGARQ